jgi:hypothetical protein
MIAHGDGGGMVRPGVATRVVLALAVAAGAAAGCQSFVPGDLTASKGEKKILKLAKADPFPSPADVGLAQPTSTP